MVDEFIRPDYVRSHSINEVEMTQIVANVVKDLNSGKEVCDYHQKSQDLLIALNTKLTVLLWVLGLCVTVFALPSVIYMVNLEKRVSLQENILQRLVEQRNFDHPKVPFR